MIPKRIVLGAVVCAFGVAGCGGGGGGSGSSSMKLGTVATLERPGTQIKVYKVYKYKAAILSVTKAGPDDLKGLTLLGDAPKNDVAFYVTQRVTGVQSDYSDWVPESPDVYDSSGNQATPLVTGSDVKQCVENTPPAGFSGGQSFESCDIYLLPPTAHVGKVVLAAEGPGQDDLTWTPG